MSKYDPLWHAVAGSETDRLTLSFAEIEAILAFPLDHSFLAHKKELAAFGFAVEKISMKAKTMTFRRLPTS